MKALIVVDVQNDFCPGGALAVPEGDLIVPVVNCIQPHFDLVVAMQDWHPKDHGSFAANHPDKAIGDVVELDGLSQILWPAHCVQDTAGAELHADLDRECIAEVFQKGTDRKIDSYSGFFDNAHRKATGLGDYLKHRGATDVYIAGLATDYCVKYTALDSAELGFATYVIGDACRGVNLAPDDVHRAIEEMRQHRVQVITSGDV